MKKTAEFRRSEEQGHVCKKQFPFHIIFKDFGKIVKTPILQSKPLIAASVIIPKKQILWTLN